jgi:hypothetical protein
VSGSILEECGEIGNGSFSQPIGNVRISITSDGSVVVHAKGSERFKMRSKKRSPFALAVIAGAGLIGSALFQPSASIAQDAPFTAAVISGTCDRPGENFGDLKDLSVGEGGVLISFSRVDIPIAELESDGYAVAVYNGEEILACGDVTGQGGDVYIALPSLTEDGYGGIAWLHDRNTQTQVSLFISNDLVSGNVIDIPEPPVEETATPVETAEPTVTATAPPLRGQETVTPTPATSSEVTHYVSPTWGYSIDYDASWDAKNNETFDTENGPQDYLGLFRPDSNALVYSNAAPIGFDVTQIADIQLELTKASDGASNVQFALGEDGKPLRGGTATEAWVVIQLTWTSPQGQSADLVDFFYYTSIPGKPAVAVYRFESLASEFNSLADVRNALLNTFEVPEA